MAKKVRKDGERKEEKKVVFEVPEFDQREYLTEQLHNIRATLFFIILAIPMGGAWAYTAIATDLNVLGLVVSIAGYVMGTQLLKYVVGVDLLEGPKRLLATTFLMYLFTSLAFAVVMTNPPANDVTEPSITDVVVCVQSPEDGAKWEVLMRHRDSLPVNKSNQDRIDDNPDQRMFLLHEGTSAHVGDNVTILVRVGDASGISNVVIQWGYLTINDTPVRMGPVDEDRWEDLNVGGDYYLWGEAYRLIMLEDVRPGNLNFLITVTDEAGLTSTFKTTVPDDSVFISSP